MEKKYYPGKCVPENRKGRYCFREGRFVSVVTMKPHE